MKLQKIGNSHMVTIPADLVKRINLEVGQELLVRVVDKEIHITPQRKKHAQKKKNIADMKLGTFSIPNFDFEESMRWIHEAHYDR